MTQEEQQSSIRKIVQAIALSFFFIVLPLGSYYYLSTGVDYRKSNLEELGDYGQLPAFNWRTQSGDLLTNEDLHGKLVVLHFTKVEDIAAQAIKLKQIARLYDQFQSSGKVVFLSSVVDADSSHRAMIQEYAAKYGMDEQKHWYVLHDEAGNLSTWQGQFPQPSDKNMGFDSYAALIDTNQVVRNFYALQEEKQVAKLAAHIALIIPQEKSREDIVFKREKEK